MDSRIISRYRDLQRQYSREVSKRWPSWAVIQRLEWDIKDLLLTYPELRDIEEEPNRRKQMKQQLIYAGVGSRITPDHILDLMEDFAQLVAEQGNWVLYSGNAIGADRAFQSGACMGKGQAIVFLPWDRYKVGGWASEFITPSSSTLYRNLKQMVADGVLEQSHVNNMSDGAKKLHARNYHQVMGYGTAYPKVSLLMCWTPEGQEVGGTRTAIRLAKAKGVMVKNLGLPEVENEVRDFILKNS